MTSVLAASDADAAWFPAAPILSPEVADMLVVLRLRNLQMMPACISGRWRIPTAALYNRCKQRRRILDRFVAGS
ncbi:hypothetical protein [Bradyrhizobium sp. CCBAU 53421]|uniref:hypothetical protein n=1 Tax=Bradyrhizobium sp. CCBAU 53421 TaxID=1325120 RepID=UPI00188A12E2|nr:hypothetical protein [Bradyrhizobium sp. CCBAU 53421]